MALEAYFHEDDYCQIELVRLENLSFVQEQLGTIDDFSEAHRAEDGWGWTGMYIRPDEPATLADLHIGEADFAKLLAGAERCDKVFTGYGDYREECPDTVGYRLGDVGLFALFKDGFAAHIWFDCYVRAEQDADDLYKLLRMIAAGHDLLFVDWSWGFYARIGQGEALRSALLAYMREHAEALED